MPCGQEMHQRYSTASCTGLNLGEALLNITHDSMQYTYYKLCTRMQNAAAITTVMRCATASPSNWCASCSQFRTLPPGSWRAPADAIISRLCSGSCTGFLCGGVSCSRLQLSSTGPCPAKPRLTTVRSLPTPVSDVPKVISRCCELTKLWDINVKNFQFKTMCKSHRPSCDHTSKTAKINLIRLW